MNTNHDHIDVHGVSLPSSTPGGEPLENFAIADLAKTAHLHQTSLGFEDDADLRGDTQVHVYVISRAAENNAGAARASRKVVDSILEQFLDEIPWYDFTQGSQGAVCEALQEALDEIHREVERSMRSPAPDVGLTLAFVRWPDMFVTSTSHGQLYHFDSASRVAESVVEHDKQSWTSFLRPLRRRKQRSSVRVWHRRLSRGDAIVLASESVARGLRLARLEDVFGVARTAEEACSLTLRASETPEKVDRTVVVARFGSTEEQLAGVGRISPSSLSRERALPTPPSRGPGEPGSPGIHPMRARL